MAKKIITPRRRRRTAGLDYEALHRLHLEAYSRMIAGAYDKAIYEAVAVAVTIHGIKPTEGEIFTFDKHPAAKKRIEGVMAGLQKRMQGIIEQGVRAEWTLANNKTDALVKRVYGKSLETMPEERKRLLLSNNEDAREAFVKRKEQGLGLSDKVWRYTDQFKAEIEMGLDVGIRAGKSADELSRSLRGFLRESNMLFRRVRDEHGQLQLSARAKAYHPGQGVYRSSYKNALRLAATETNIAYRTADHERQQALDFVVGVEVHLSGNHTLNGKPFRCMCDDLVGKYPKDFKFTGWHPLCRCYTTPILKTPEEMARDTQKLLRGEPVDGHSVNEVKDLPHGFKTWMEENKSRIEGAKSLPYFIKDNPQWTSLQAKPSAPTGEERRAKILERAKARHEARTAEQISEIQKRWDELNASHIVDKAIAVKDEVQQYAERIAHSFGATVTPINLKSKASIVRKLNTYDVNHSVFKVKDAVRTTIIAPATQIDALRNHFRTQIGGTVLRVKEQRGAGLLGYTGTIVNIRCSNGIVGEVQINTPRMIYAKEKPEDAMRILGRELWEKIRRETGMDGGLGHKYYEEFRLLSEEEQRSEKGEALRKASEAYYDRFRG